nr:six-bladed beta-propeller, TolB-like protein [Tanacetum cinerariifolium]
GNQPIYKIQLLFDDCAYQYGSGFPLEIAGSVCTRSKTHLLGGLVMTVEAWWNGQMQGKCGIKRVAGEETNQSIRSNFLSMIALISMEAVFLLRLQVRFVHVPQEPCTKGSNSAIT